MKSFQTAAAAFLALATSVVAQKQSAPFYLQAISKNSTINGTYFFAGHEGAAIEGLLVGGKKPLANKAYDSYRLNNTASYPNQGTLSWTLVSGNIKESEPMSFYIDPSTNVALPLFEPGYNTQEVGFDSENKMYIPTYVNDRVTPPKAGKTVKLYNWYTCTTYYTGYTYLTLNWLLGTEYPPQNPSCEKVTVIRKFV